MVETGRVGAGNHAHIAVAPGSLDRLARPEAGVQVIRRAFIACQVHRHLSELQRGAALQEQHFVGGRHPEDVAQVLFGFTGHRHEYLRTMADFHHGHAGAGEIEKLLVRLSEDVQRHRGGACAEVV